MTRARSLGLALISIIVIFSVILLSYSQSSTDFRKWRINGDIVDLPLLRGSTSDGNLSPAERDFSAGNSTLGFGAILALSQGTKWRVDGLRAGAAASGIDLQIPAQPSWSQEFITAFETFGPVAAHGAALAWLGHIDLLKYVIQNRWGSALIMEDDVDWSVDIRNQTSLIADAVLELTDQKGWLKRKKHGQPYGDNWDVLWLGHCSDPPDMLQPIVRFKDASVISWDKYRAIDRYMTTVLEEGERGVYKSFNPVCTFAYAVSAKGAKKLLAQASTGKGGAFDLMLNYACRDGVLDCISVSPEIFDSYHPAEGDLSEVRAGDDGAESNKGFFDTAFGQAMGHSDNIWKSARCAGLWKSTCLTEGLA